MAKNNSTHPRLVLRTTMLTDVGVVREHNEDAAFVDDEGDFFVVADGMGGHAAGEVASAMAVETVRDALAARRTEFAKFSRSPTDDGRKVLVDLLEAGVRQAHDAVYQRGIREADKQGMGTTLDVVLLAGSEAFVAHVGDSRTYLVRDGKAAQLTTDHTVAEVLVIEGKLSLEEAQISPLRTILVNAIGVAPDVGVEMAHVHLRKGDQILVCSDGLHDYFPAEQEIADFMSDGEPNNSLSTMIELAKTRGGHDNITGVVFEVLDAPPELELSAEKAAQGPITLTPSGAAAVPEPLSPDDTMPHEQITEDDAAATSPGRISVGPTDPVPVEDTPPASAPEPIVGDETTDPRAARPTVPGKKIVVATNDAASDEKKRVRKKRRKKRRARKQKRKRAREQSQRQNQ